MRARFITIEGADGAGKSEQVVRLCNALHDLGVPVYATREPGGCEGAEKIRGLLLALGNTWDPDTEVMLHFAARREHVQKVIRPKLSEGTWVISDRFYDSTRAYQGFGSGADPSLIADLTLSTGVRPSLTIVLDVSEEEAASRLSSRPGFADRYEAMGADYFARVREGYRQIAGEEPRRCALVDACQTRFAVHDDIMTSIYERGLLQKPSV